MKTSSAKQKGRLLQQKIRDEILKVFPSLTERDVRSTPMGCPGADIMLSEAAIKLFPYSVESKNQESLSIWSSLAQAESENRELTPLLVFKRNFSDVYCALKFEDFMKLVELIAKSKDLKREDSDKNVING